MAQDMERSESITLIEEIFTALGTLDETFTFAGPIAYFPNGIREVAYKNAQNNKWVDLNPKHYQLDIGGVSFSFIGAFSLPVGTQVRCLYTSPGGGAVTVAGTVDVQQVIPDEPVSATVTVGAVATALGVGTVLNGVIVLADQDNADDVWVGDSGVTVGNGYRLGAGESCPVPASDISKVYAIAVVAGDKVHYIGG